MTTKAKAVSEIAENLGNRRDLDARIVRRWGRVQTSELERAPQLPWFLLSEDSYTDVVEEQERVNLPTRFLREFERGALWYEDAGLWTPLRKERHETLKYARGRDNYLAKTGRPSHYDLVGDYFYLSPIPDTTYRLWMKYYKRAAPPDEMSDSQTNAWLDHAADLVIAMVTLDVAQSLQYRDDLIRKFKEDVQSSWYRYNTEIISRDEVNKPRSMGED